MFLCEFENSITICQQWVPVYQDFSEENECCVTFEIHHQLHSCGVPAS